MNLINVAQAGVISDAPSISNIGMNILNFLLSVAGIIAIIALVVSGAMYFMAMGDEKKMQKAKRSASYAVLGIIMSMSGMAVVLLIGKFFSAQ